MAMRSGQYDDDYTDYRGTPYDASRAGQTVWNVWSVSDAAAAVRGCRWS